MTRVKICGITGATDRDAVVAAGADAVGVIVDVPVDTPREIEAAIAERLVARTPPFVTTVLVTMPDSVQAAVSLQEQIGADAIQVHAGLTPAQVGGLRKRTDAEVLGVVSSDSEDVAAYADVADGLFVDAVDDVGAGGTGETTDWDRAAELVDELSVPVILAGGLDPSNVATAIEIVQPYGVDTASGVERQGGRKNRVDVEAFVDTANEMVDA